MKNLLLGITAVAMATSAMAALPTLNGNLTVNNNVTRQATLKSADGRMQFVPKQDLNVNRPMQAPAATSSLVFSDDFEAETWTIVDNQGSSALAFPMQLGGLQGVDAYSGEWYLISGYDSQKARNAWAFSQGVELEAGVTYSVGVYAYAAGFSGVLDEWKVTVGTQASEAGQTTTVIDRTGSNAASYTEWTLCAGEFTPTTAGTYYFGINHCTPVADVNAVAFDLFQVDDAAITVYPSGSMYSEGGIWSIMSIFEDESGVTPTPALYTTVDAPITYNYTGRDIESVEWMFGDYTSITTSTEASPSIYYELTAEEDSINTDVYLTMYNGENAVSAEPRNYDVKDMNSARQFVDFVGNFQPEDVPVCYTNSQTNQYSALFGLSEINHEFAEYYEIPANTTLDVSGVMLMAYGYTAPETAISDEITVSVCTPDADGMPGEVVGSTTVTLADVFTGYAQILIPFDAPVTVTGSFFITLNLPDVTPSASYYLMLYMSQGRAFPVSTLYLNIDDASLGVSTGWYNVSELYSMNAAALMSPMIQYQMSGLTSSKLDNNSMVYTNGKELNIVNVAAGSRVMVTDISGRTVLVDEVGNNVRTTINTNLTRGIYLVTVDGKTTKVAIR